MRTFIAAELGENVLAGLTELMAELKPFGRDIRWAKPQGIHLTFKFLGEITPNQIVSIDEALSRAVTACEPCRVKAGTLGGFPDLKRPRVLWVGLDNIQALENIHRPVERELAQIGFPPEKRAFRPHLTLGRIKSLRAWSQVYPHVEKRKYFSAGDIFIDHLVFFESRLRPSGAEYIKFKEYPFAI